MTELGTLLGGRWLILLDFDGPICGVFSGIPSDVVAQELLGMIGDPPVALTGAQDPFRVLEYAAQSRPELAADIERRSGVDRGCLCAYPDMSELRQALHQGGCPTCR